MASLQDVRAHVWAHHGEAVALVAVHHVGQQLGGRAHRYPLPIVQLIQPALHGRQPSHPAHETHADCLHAAQHEDGGAHLLAQVALPELAVGSAARHGAEEVGIDLYHLLHRLRGCTRRKRPLQRLQGCERPSEPCSGLEHFITCVSTWVVSGSSTHRCRSPCWLWSPLR